MTSALATAIDTHVHVDDRAYRPLEEYRADALSPRAVLVEHFASDDNTYLRAAVNAYPTAFRGALLLRLDGSHTSTLDVLASDPLIRCARIQVKALEQLPALEVILHELESIDARASLHISADLLADPMTARLLDSHVDLPLRIEHFGLYPYDSAPAAAARQALFQVFARPGIYTMVSGLYACTGEPYPYPSAAAVIEEYRQEFGTSRLMWSEDWNRNDLDPHRSDDYKEEAFRFVTDALDASSVETRDIFTGAAEAFFGF